MWIRKIERDLKKGVDSPLPTQSVSNEEYIPRPQNERQKQLEHLIGEMSIERARKLSIDRRLFMSSAPRDSYQSHQLGHLANPKGMEKAALQNPDFNFVVYHSAIKHGPSEPNYLDSNKFDPTTGFQLLPNRRRC